MAAQLATANRPLPGAVFSASGGATRSALLCLALLAGSAQTSAAARCDESQASRLQTQLYNARAGLGRMLAERERLREASAGSVGHLLDTARGFARFVGGLLSPVQRDVGHMPRVAGAVRRVASSLQSLSDATDSAAEYGTAHAAGRALPAANRSISEWRLLVVVIGEEHRACRQAIEMANAIAETEAAAEAQRQAEADAAAEAAADAEAQASSNANAIQPAPAGAALEVDLDALNREMAEAERAAIEHEQQALAAPGSVEPEPLTPPDLGRHDHSVDASDAAEDCPQHGVRSGRCTWRSLPGAADWPAEPTPSESTAAVLVAELIGPEAAASLDHERSAGRAGAGRWEAEFRRRCVPHNDSRECVVLYCLHVGSSLGRQDFAESCIHRRLLDPRTRDRNLR